MQNDLRKLLEDIKLRWKNSKEAKTGWLFPGSRFSLAVPFFLKSLDELMVFVSKYDVEGIIKKTNVMEAVNELYSLLIEPLLPIYLKPFSSKIHDLVVNVVISNLIDFLVTKIRSVKVDAI